MLILVGLGNPGPKHAKNRHNFGFMAAEEIARGADFRELAGPGCKIPKTEERAITLKQLRAVMANIRQNIAVARRFQSSG